MHSGHLHKGIGDVIKDDVGGGDGDGDGTGVIVGDIS